jgi:hypothetical protein
MYLLISMPAGTEWIIILFLLGLVPFLCYRLGYRVGKRAGELEALRRNQGQ